MTLTQTSVFRRCIRYCRKAGLLLSLVSAGASAQHLTLLPTEAVLPEPTLVAVVAPLEPATTTEMYALASTAGPGGETLAASGDSASVSSAKESLPESPSATLFSHSLNSVQPLFADPQFGSMNPQKASKTSDGRPIAPLYTKYIPPDWVAQPIHGREKLILGARDLYSSSNIAAIFISAGFSHFVDGQPNYGVNREAFAKRLGATAIRETAEGILTDGVFAVVFHQDPRYFAEGPKYNVVHRALYAATRPIIVRTTNGTGSTINSSLLTGYAAATLLNNAFYPQINRNVKDNFTSFGGSIGGAALGFVVSEFSDDALYFLHLKRKP